MERRQIADSSKVRLVAVILLLLVFLFLNSCQGPRTSRVEGIPMPAIGTVRLSLLSTNADAQIYRKFLRLLTEEAVAEPLQGDVTRFEIGEADDIDRWMVIDFSARGARYRIEGQLLSPDILSPTDQALCFRGRIAYSSLSYENGPLDLTNSRDAFNIMAPMLISLGRRVCGLVGLPNTSI